MKTVLFLPLNTNHILIFKTLLESLKEDFIFVSHDNISEAKQYHTSKMLESLGLPFLHFPKKINRSLSDNIFLKILNFFLLRNSIKKLLGEIKPKVIVMGTDNDPLNQIFLNEAKRRSIKTILMQEALIRPLEYTMRRKYRSDRFMNLLREMGIFINYIPYGSGGCDKILLGGKRSYDILKSRGISEKYLKITGLPKYDEIVKKLAVVGDNKKVKNNSFLFVASTLIVNNEENIYFLKTLVTISEKINLKLIIKLHPRTEHEPKDIYNILDKTENQYLRILKGGDETSKLLNQVRGFITVSSTVILDALMMNKKCVVVDYLAGESQLKYDLYDAVFQISKKEEIENVLKQAMKEDKNQSNKRRLLEDELYILDGQSNKRVADFITSYANN
jgi:hypothetical protein